MDNFYSKFINFKQILVSKIQRLYHQYLNRKNSIYIHPTNKLFVSGGDDKVIRFYSIIKEKNQKFEVNEIWNHEEHQNSIKNIDGSTSGFYLSTDSEKIIVVNLQKKQIVRKVFSDNLSPVGSCFQSAYFSTHKQHKNNINFNGHHSIIMCHYLLRSSAYISRQLADGMMQTMKVSSDQSCLTAKNGRYIGIACGQGTTYLIDTTNFKCIGEDKRHNFVITAATMTQSAKFITGTPQCSYFVQQANQANQDHILAALLVVVVLCLFHLFNSTNCLTYGEL